MIFFFNFFIYLFKNKLNYLNMRNYNIRGSEWLKWDLQVGTKYYTHYKGLSITDKDKLTNLVGLTGLDAAQINSKHEQLDDEEYAKLFVEYYVKYTDVNVIGIANHNTGKGIDEIIQYLESKKDYSNLSNIYNQKYIFPGVEIGACDKAHIILVFNPYCTSKHFYKYDINGKLQSQKSLSEYIDDFLTHIDIKEPRITNNNPINSSWNSVKIINLAEEWDFIPVFPHVGNSNGIWKELHENNRRNIYLHQYFGIVDTGNSKDSTLLRVLAGLHSEWGNKKIAKIETSDSTSIDEIGKRFSYIKADPTFEGLKQIMYEPDSRVCLQQDGISDNKDNHLVIESAKFYCSDKTFPDSPIYFNRNLNVIIGGKSSGKSLLLTCIAEVLKGNTDLRTKYDLQEKVKDFDFEVKLVSTGLNDKLSNHKGGRNASIIPEIKYISQNELATLADHQIKKISNQLNKLVRGLLREDSETNRYYENFLQNVKAFDKEREDIINKYFEVLETKSSLQKSVFELGQKSVIEISIIEKEDNIKEITNKIGFLDEEKKEYEQIKLEIENQNIELERLSKDSAVIIDFFSDSESALRKIDSDRDNLIKEIINNNKLLVDLKMPLESLENVLNLFFSAGVGDAIQRVLNEIQSKIKDDIIALNERLKPFLSKIENQKILDELEKSLKEQKEKKESIEKKEMDLKNIERHLLETKEHLFLSFRKVHSEYTALIQNFEKRCSLLKDDKLSITGKTFYNFSKFRKTIIQHISGRKNSNWDYARYPVLSDKMSSMSLDDANLDNIIFSLSNLFDAVIAGDYSLNQSTTIKNFLKLIFDDYFYDYWNVEYQGDNLGKMSAGKASFVILMLIVGLSKSKSPLLIDQPEDNLDNRSISTDLVNYIRNKKNERQIILVTHNPNIVVNADAENIIVADQRGQDNNSTCPFQFNYINGAIESTNSKDLSITDTLNSMGIREHITEIVEGGEEAFMKRERKYNFKR